MKAGDCIMKRFISYWRRPLTEDKGVYFATGRGMAKTGKVTFDQEPIAVTVETSYNGNFDVFIPTAISNPINTTRVKRFNKLSLATKQKFVYFDTEDEAYDYYLGVIEQNRQTLVNEIAEFNRRLVADETKIARLRKERGLSDK